MAYASYQLPVDDELAPLGVAVGEMDPTNKWATDILNISKLTPKQQEILGIRQTGTDILNNPAADNTLLIVGAAVLLGIFALGKLK